MGSRGRDAVARFASVVERLWDRNSDDLIPPAHLRGYYYRTWKQEAFTRASKGAAAELISRGLQADHRLLDIGSGIGNLAIGLSGYLRGGYDGLEIHPEAVTWCQRAITRRHPEFRFHHADVFSRAYNPHGRAKASEYRFPFSAREFDFVFLGSVFTHMLPDAVERYVSEISRVLAPNGICIASCFLLNPDTRPGVEGGHSFMSFPVEHPSRLCRLHDADIPEAAVALDEVFVRRIYANAGLEIRDLRRGGWWNGLADDQDVVTAGLEANPR